jgi:acetylserotonin N-methyltransferase
MTDGAQLPEMTLTPTPDSGADAAAKIAIPDPAPVLALIDAFRSSKVMFVAVSLGLFDSLEREPSSVERLAAELQLQSEPLQRLLDACAGLGLLHKHDGIYKNEPVASTYLRRGTPNTLAGYILYSDKVLFQLWAHLENSIRQGGPQWKQAFHLDGSIFDHFFRTDDDMQAFLQGMHGFGTLSSPLVVSAFDLSRFKTFVDLGGATGHLAIAACERYPRLNAVLFDLPRVIDAVQHQISLCSVASRIELKKGDFFSQEQLPAADLFGLGRILHDWPDEKVSGLLRAIHQRLPSGGGILLAEKLLNEDKTGPIAAQLQSLNMLVCTEGKERTLGEFRALLESAGFAEVRGCVTGASLDAIFALKP